MNVHVSSCCKALLCIGIACQVVTSDAATSSLPSCVSPAEWTSVERDELRLARSGAVLADMAKRDVVLLGEVHEQEDDHRWQLQVLAALQAQRPKLVIGFEMFPRRVQPVLDRWVAGELTVKDLLEQTDWENVWGFPAAFYVPLFEFARINRIPMVALNVDQKLIKAITAKGSQAVAQGEREGVGHPAAPSKDYRDWLSEIYREHSSVQEKSSGAGNAGDAAFDYFVEAQTTWDRAMAEAIAQRVRRGDNDRPLVVGIMGSGHVRFGFGVPHQLRALGVTSIGTLLPVRSDIDCQSLRSGLADAVFTVPAVAAPKTERPRLGVRLEEKEGVRIAEVTPGSLADLSGIKAGDTLLQVAGSDVRNSGSVIGVVRQQPAGTWLPVRIKRGAENLDIVIRFPPKP